VIGVLLDAELLVSSALSSWSPNTERAAQAKVPSVMQGIKNTGLLVGTFGTQDQMTYLSSSSMDGTSVDAILRDGLFVCLEQSMRALV
jgi:hypothetical protein